MYNANSAPLQKENSILAKSIMFAKNDACLIVSGFILLYLLQIIYYLFLHPLHNVPGPFLARFSGMWKHIRYFRSSWHIDTLELHERYGPVARIAPNEVSFVDPRALTLGETETDWIR